MRIAMTGSSGLIGTALVDSLVNDGHVVVRVVRRRAEGAVFWDPAAGLIDADSLEDLDAVIHLAGEGIGDRRWNDAHLARVRDSRVQGTELLANTLAGLRRPPGTLISASAIGYYGDRGDEVLTESSPAGRGTLADLCVAWEAATAPASAAGIRVSHLRTGIVMAPQGGALKRLITVYKWGLGGRMGSGRQYMSWISLADEVGIIKHALTASLAGPVNVTAPNPVTNAELNKALGKALKRPSFMVVPAFAPKLLLGRDMAQHLLFDSARVMPVAAQDSGYEFVHPTLQAYLRSEFER